LPLHFRFAVPDLIASTNGAAPAISACETKVWRIAWALGTRPRIRNVGWRSHHSENRFETRFGLNGQSKSVIRGSRNTNVFGQSAGRCAQVRVAIDGRAGSATVRTPARDLAPA
jgi:hypothetical protein